VPVSQYVEKRVGPTQEALSSQREAPSPAERRDLQDVRCCLDGDPDAYRRLVQRHQQQISAIIWQFSRDPETHEDLVQDAFVEAYQSLRTYRAKAPFPRWLARIARRVGYRHWKRQEREAAIQTVPFEDWGAALEQAAETARPSEAAEMLFQLLGQLSPRDRLVLTLRYIENESVAGTAEATGWSKTMVKVQAWRARSKLRKLFEKATRRAES
jgi:RNA polymerase sigma-70 factor (ECF subfamily)